LHCFDVGICKVNGPTQTHVSILIRASTDGQLKVLATPLSCKGWIRDASDVFGHHARAAVALGGAHAFKVPGFIIEAEGWQVNGKTALSCEFSKRGIGNLGDEIDTRVVKAWCRVVDGNIGGGGRHGNGETHRCAARSRAQRQFHASDFCSSETCVVEHAVAEWQALVKVVDISKFHELAIFGHIHTHSG
tara:strand:+ start:2419 stop:2988 length:570 start_codon:yes stop_codon:yes gene_type:complete